MFFPSGKFCNYRWFFYIGSTKKLRKQKRCSANIFVSTIKTEDKVQQLMRNFSTCTLLNWKVNNFFFPLNYNYGVEGLNFRDVLVAQWIRVKDCVRFNSRTDFPLLWFFLYWDQSKTTDSKSHIKSQLSSNKRSENCLWRAS